MDSPTRAQQMTWLSGLLPYGVAVEVFERIAHWAAPTTSLCRQARQHGDRLTAHVARHRAQAAPERVVLPPLWGQRSSPVDPPLLLGLREGRMGGIRIGTSGWAYRHWRGVFYPEGLRQADWFRHYAEHFDTVEINNSFYRLPSEAAFDTWREQAPPGFVYAVKASRFLTHFKKLKDPEAPLKTFFDRADRLRRTLGPVLYQLPPHWGLDLPRFEHFLGALPAGHVHVVEFRDESWMVEDAFRLMERRGVSHCVHDSASARSPLRVTASPAYVRFHGDPKRGGDYTDKAMETWARRIEEWSGRGLDVFIYFNNDVEGYAIENANTLKAMLGEAVFP